MRLRGCLESVPFLKQIHCLLSNSVSPKIFGLNINDRSGPFPGSTLWGNENIHNRSARFWQEYSFAEINTIFNIPEIP